MKTRSSTPSLSLIIFHCTVDVDENDGEAPLRMLTWSCKGVEYLSEPSKLPYSATWDHSSTENQAQGLWEVGGTDTY